MHIWRLPRGSNTLLLCSAASLTPVACSRVVDLLQISKSVKRYRDSFLIWHFLCNPFSAFNFAAVYLGELQRICEKVKAING